MKRMGSAERTTLETSIRCTFTIDGQGNAKVNTGIGFLDHMLTSLAKHGLFDVDVACKGDLHIDAHHTVEDLGIVMGKAMKQALQDKAGIVRCGTAFVPMDEALSFVTLDISGRPYLKFEADFKGAMCGAFDTQLTEEFFRGLAMEAGLTLHMNVLYGANDHHMIESLFKAFARALDAASRLDGRFTDIPSTKGVLE